MTKSDNKQVESDLDRARERLSFYEQFDEIIKQNIASSSALLKEASARLDNDFVAERNRYRALLSEILGDLTALQSQSEKLARRVTDALDELEGSGAHSNESVAPQAAAMGLTTEASPEAAAVINAATGSTRKKVERPKSTQETTAKVVAEDEAGAPEAPVAAPVVAAPIAAAASIDFSNPASTTLLVHGVPRASAALALKTYVEKLDFVTTVEPREFAAGLLRLQVEGARPLSLGDLSGWTLADRIELRNASNELLELNLIPA